MFHAFQAGHVVEGDGAIAHFIAFGGALAEPAHQPAEKRIPRAAEQEPQPHEQPHRHQHGEQHHEGRVVAGLANRIPAAQVLPQEVVQIVIQQGILRQRGDEALLQRQDFAVTILFALGIERRIAEFAQHLGPLHFHLGDVAMGAGELLVEKSIGDLRAFDPLAIEDEKGNDPRRHQQQPHERGVGRTCGATGFSGTVCFSGGSDMGIPQTCAILEGSGKEFGFNVIVRWGGSCTAAPDRSMLSKNRGGSTTAAPTLVQFYRFLAGRIGRRHRPYGPS